MTNKVDNERHLFTDINYPLTLDQENRLLTSRIVECKNEKSEWATSHYGHAALTLAVLQRNVSACEASPEDQRAALIKQRDQLVAKFGLRIINFLREELRID